LLARDVLDISPISVPMSSRLSDPVLATLFVLWVGATHPMTSRCFGKSLVVGSEQSFLI
jgi:hypothetical protein